KRQGIPRICHGFECVGRRCASCGAPRLAASGAGSAGDPQRAFVGDYRLTEGFTDSASEDFAHHSRRRLPPGGPEILPAAAESRGRSASGKKESCFFGVKSFSYTLTKVCAGLSRSFASSYLLLRF